METYLEKLFSFIHSIRIWVFGLCLISILFCAMGFFNNLSVDNSLGVWFEESNEDFKNYRDFLRHFGSDRKIYIKIGGNPTEPGLLIKTEQLARQFAAIKGIFSVKAATSSAIIYSREGDLIQSTFEQWLLDKKSLVDLWKLNPIYKKWIPQDGFLIELLLEPDLTLNATYSVLNQLRDLKKIHRFEMGGIPILDTHFNQLVWRDQLVLFPASVLFIVLILFLTTGSLTAAFVVAVIQTFVLFFILRLSQWLGYPLSIITGLVCPLVVCVSVLNSAYLLQSFEKSFKEWAIKVKCLLRPAIYTELTTIAGFASFGMTNLLPMTQLSILSSLGIFFSLAATLLLLPPLIGVTPSKRKIEANWLDTFLKRTTGFLSTCSMNHPRKILFLFGALSLFFIFGFNQLTLQTRFENYFFDHDPLAKEFKNFNPENQGEINWILAGSSNWMYQQEGFELIAKVDDYFRLLPGTNEVVSQKAQFDFMADLLALAKPVQWENALILQMDLLLSQLTVNESFTSEDKVLARVGTQVKFSDLDSLYYETHLIKNHLKEILLVDAIPTGYEYMLSLLHQKLKAGQKQSFFISILVVAFMMIFMTKKFWLGLITMIPNLLPIIFTFGFMGFFKIPLDVATILVGAIATGVTVDDTIHFLERFNTQLDLSKNTRLALSQTIESVGLAMSKSALVLMGGFLIFTLGSLKPTVIFGFISAITFFIAYLCEYLLMPALIITFVKNEGA